ncbi:hypothetical protein NIA71_01365 [Ihubacter massiliensis]|uniref:Tail fiber protein n=1 Tax=Hominibacterium faecale TaxID=2839743 RepID=A0A9J6QZV4_9FIRM|nr:MULTISPECIES: hypothetical protein [Eubacteriales Family XIII. Incertae Sedis]MCO7120604.1 hypothetical protein [Ihubacter massiliensis]MCU7381062.1 hypothetical protein [Hominibacterium faecale]
MVDMLNTILQGLLADMTQAKTLKDGYIVLPNGLKLCWGLATGKKYGDQIALPLSYEKGLYFMQPNYNMDFTMYCTFSSMLFSGNKISVGAYDVVNRTQSTRTDLSVTYFAIGY